MAGAERRPVLLDHDVGQRHVLDEFGVVPEHAGQRGRGRIRSRRCEETSMVMAAALWTRERNRATSSRATSNRRRSVRSRMLNSTAPSANQLTGVPISSSRRQPVGVFSPHLQGGPDLLGLDGDQRAPRPAPGRRGGRGREPTALRTPPGCARTSLRPWRCPTTPALCPEDDDHIGQLVEEPGQRRSPVVIRSASIRQ